MKLAPAVIALLLVLSGCAAGPPEPDGEAGDTRTVEHALGTVVVPQSPRRVVALDENAGVTALSYGVRPVAVFTGAGDPVLQRILAGAGIPLQDVAVVTLPDPERIVALAPDLLVGTGAAGPAGAGAAELSRIAPTVVLDIEGPWDALVAGSAAVFGAEATGRRQVEATRSLLERARGARPGRELSLLGNTFGATTFTMPPQAPVSVLVTEAGFVRPAAQRRPAPGYSVVLSPETLGEHDADLIAVPEGRYYTAGAITDLPVFRSLRGRTVRPVGETWFGVHPFAFHATARDLLALAEERRPAGPDELVGIWNGYLEETT